MAKIDHHLPLRTELDFFQTTPLTQAAEQYADGIVSSGQIRPDQRKDLVAALIRAGAYYRLGRDMNDKIMSNKATAKELHRERYEDIAKLLKIPSKGQPPHRGECALIWVMTLAWEYFGLNPGTAYGRGAGQEASPFQRICNGWIQRIEEIPEFRDHEVFEQLPGRRPNRRPSPSRTIYRKARAQLKEQDDD